MRSSYLLHPLFYSEYQFWETQEAFSLVGDGDTDNQLIRLDSSIVDYLDRSSRLRKGSIALRATSCSLRGWDKSVNVVSLRYRARRSTLGKEYVKCLGRNAFASLEIADPSSRVLTCNILHLFVTHWSSTQGWYIPSVMQFRRITIMLTLSNHVDLG